MKNNRSKVWSPEKEITSPATKRNGNGMLVDPKRQRAGIWDAFWKDGHKARKKKWRNPALMTEREKEGELDRIQERINELEAKIRDNEKRAGKILFNSLEHARKIGMLLIRAKKLLPHGEYQEWVRNWFIGGLSTARTYKQIAEHWSSIRFNVKGKIKTISIREALGLLQEKFPMIPEYGNGVRTLVGQFERMIAKWHGYVCLSAAKSPESMEELERTLTTILKRHGGTPPEKEGWNDFDDDEPVEPRLRTLPNGRKVLWYGPWSVPPNWAEMRPVPSR